MFPVLSKVSDVNQRCEIWTFSFDKLFSFIDEPTTVAAGGYSERHPEIIKQIQEIIDDGVSLIAVDPENSKLVGMMLSHTVEKSNVENRGTYDDFLKTFPPLHSAIMCLFDEIMYPGDLFESHPDDTKVSNMGQAKTTYARGKGDSQMSTIWHKLK